MKVKIGKYVNYYGPYQLAEKILFWMDKNEDKRVYKFGHFLAHGFHKEPEEEKVFRLRCGLPKTWLYKLLEWIHSKQNRKIKVHIDRWDTWSMDNTLAYIIIPMLKKLNEEKHGAPWTDDEDVPEELRSTNAPTKENEYDTDDNHFKRWDWIIAEMIWAFEQKIDDDGEIQFYSGESDIFFEKIDDSDCSEMKKGPKYTFKIDNEGLKKYHDRVKNGFRLFGKYYQNLWD